MSIIADQSSRGGARVLSLDAGDAKCLSSLIIVEALMEHVKTLMSLPQTPKPCEYFDLICGSGLGGVSALMLGRLQMSAKMAIQWFKEIPQGKGPRSKETDEQRHERLTQNTREYEDFIKRMVAQYATNSTTIGGSSDPSSSEPFEDSNEDACKTLVLAMDRGWIRVPVRFRSYSSRMNSTVGGYPIWRVARAAISTPTRYLPAKSNDERSEYIDSMYGCANPAKEALDEALRIWSLPSIGCFISVGSTELQPACIIQEVNSEKLKRRMLDATWRIATDAERVAIEIARDARMLGFRYFRFNCPWPGSTHVSIQDIYTTTRAYLRSDGKGSHIDNNLRFCGQSLLRSLEVETNRGRGRVSDQRTSSLTVSRLPRGRSSIPDIPKRPPRDRSVPLDVNTQGGDFAVLFDARPGSDDSSDSGLSEEWFSHLASVHNLINKCEKISADINPSPNSLPYDGAVKIAVLDTGVDEMNFTIRKAMKAGRIKDVKSFTPDNETSDKHGHGTHVAGLVLKVAPDADIYIARVLTSNVKSAADLNQPQRVAQAINFAVTEWAVDIITMSFGFPKRVAEVDEAILNAFSKKKVLFAAAANHGANKGIAYPASKLGVVFCVNATDGKGDPANFNPPSQPNRDNFCTLGVDVDSAWTTLTTYAQPTRRMSGTSVATPIAAGLAALAMEFGRRNRAKIGPSELEILHSYDGIQTIFEKTHASTKTYKYLSLWEVLSSNNAVEDVCGFINIVLQKI